MILVVAEKPSVARELARVIGAKTKGENCLVGNGYTVTWAIGHLVALQEPGEIKDEWKHWKKEALPMLPEEIPLKVLPKTKAQFNTVKKLMNASETERIICATDAGREGELIFRYIYQEAKCKKPFDRLWISSMTDEAIKEGFQHLKEGTEYNRLFESAKCRSEADWLIGMNASRAFTIRYRALLSIGRVQTPTLQILVKRRNEIDSFTPEPYYTLQSIYPDFRGLWFSGSADETNNTHIKTREKAQEIADKVKGKKAVVQKIERKSKRELPPLLYDLTSLQRDANNRYGFSAGKTLDIAQALYEKHKLITYPRTDSKCLPTDAYGLAGKAIQQLPAEYAELSAPLLKRPLPKSTRVFDNSKISDHHAIIPTGKTVNMERLTKEEAKVFDLIARRLIAAFYPSYDYESIQAILTAEGESFISKGIEVKQSGWKAVYENQSKKADRAEDETQTLPSLQVGDSRAIQQTIIANCMTKPPKEYTDASLLSAMEHAGKAIDDEELAQAMRGCSLGTPATRAAIIDRLIEVGYAKRQGKQIIAAEKGVSLIAAVPNEMASPELTARWELELEKISRGEGNSLRFMDGIRKMSAYVAAYAFEKAPDDVIKPEEYQSRKKGRTKKSVSVKQTDIVCPICGKGYITENSKAFGCSRWKEGCKLTIWKNAVQRIGGPEIQEKLIRLLLASPDGKLRGSNGVLIWKDNKIEFVPDQKQ